VKNKAEIEEAMVAKEQESSIHRIVVGIDGSPSSTAVSDWAARQAELTGFVLEAVISWEWPLTYGGGVLLPNDYDPATDAHKMLDHALEAVRLAYPDITIRPVVVEGHPAPVLVEAAKGADLLVVGSRGHGEFSGMLLGSVSQHCTHHVSCPITIVRG
jgi:nucleotide-binding universal stress UspA family protein